ncbi:Hypothetical predicted protein, partial [Marmota monax]
LTAIPAELEKGQSSKLQDTSTVAESEPPVATVKPVDQEGIPFSSQQLSWGILNPVVHLLWMMKPVSTPLETESPPSVVAEMDITKKPWYKIQRLESRIFTQ